MTKYASERRSSRIDQRLAAAALLAWVVVMMLAGQAGAQSTDRDNPTPLAANEIRGQGSGKKVEYYYTFLAGPGEVILTIDSGAKGSFSQFEAVLFDLDAEKLAQVATLPYPGETERKVKRVSLGAQQPVLLRLLVDREAGQYLARIGGAAQFAGADASFSGASASPATSPAPAPGATETPAPTDPAAAPPATSPTTPTPDPAATTDVAAATPPAAKVSGLKKFWLRLSQAGELLGLVGLGTLHLEMSDGSAQDIGLGKIRKVLVGEAMAAPADGSNITPSGEDKMTSWQRLWLKLGAAGEIAGLSGRPFRLEMKDGTVQEFSAAKVKRVSFKR